MKRRTRASALAATLALSLSLLGCPANRSTEPDIRTFTPAAITMLCPDHIGGDREFKGHGPEVTVRANLGIRASSKEVWLDLYLHAKETQSDWTEAEKTWERRLWTAPAGYTIASFKTDRQSEASYTDTDHQLDKPEVRGGSLVSSFEVMGDTGGNDVGNCTDDDVYLSVYFNEVQILVEPEST